MKHPIFDRVDELKDRVCLMWHVEGSEERKNHGDTGVMKELSLYILVQFDKYGDNEWEELFTGSIASSCRSEFFDLLLEKLNELYPPESEPKASESRRELKCPQCGAGNESIGWTYPSLSDNTFVIARCTKCNLETKPFKDLSEAYAEFEKKNQAVKERCPWCGGSIGVTMLDNDPKEEFRAYCDVCDACGPTMFSQVQAIERFIRGTK